MSFLGLVSDEAPVNLDEIARLNWIIKEMERRSVILRDERDIAVESVKGMQEHNKIRDKERNQLMKTINKLKMEIKLEQKSASGLTKKSATMEIDLQLRKEERAVMMEEQIFNRRKVKEQEKQLMDDRAKRLRNIHENEILTRKNVELEARCTTAEAAERKAAADLLEKLQKLETALDLVDSQKRTIESQGDEMLELNREITLLKEAMRDMSDRCLKLERQIADRQKEKDAFEQEAFRLRREIMQLGLKTSEKAAAFASFEPRSRAGTASTSRAATAENSLQRPNTTMTGHRSPAGSSDIFSRTRSTVVSTARGGSPMNNTERLRALSGHGARSGASTPGRSTGVFFPPELDDGPVLSDMSTPGDTRPRTRHIDTKASGSNMYGTGSFSPARPSTGGAVLAPLTEPDKLHSTLPNPVNTFGPEASEVTFSAGELGEDSIDMETSYQMENSGALSPAVVPPSPSTPKVKLALTGSPGNKKRQERIMSKKGPLSDMAISYLNNTKSPGTSLQGRGGVRNTRGVRTPKSSSGPNHTPLNPELASLSLSEKRGSGYTGSGLGLAREPTPQYSAGGSAKQVLKRILMESESMD